MRRLVITGAGGFVGYTTSKLALDSGYEVLGVDVVNDHYAPRIKRANIEELVGHPGFRLVEDDLLTLDLKTLLSSEDVIIHLAALAGVRTSWASNFGSYVENNVLATQKILEVANQLGIQRVVYASSSSVYGDGHSFPVTEQALTAPHSPYGVTKLAGEHLCSLYARNFGLPTVSLRYFTVYGPRQRPDMAIHRLIEAGLHGHTFSLFGDGEQRRDFTFVDDVARANLLAASVADVAPGTVVNTAGGNDISMNELVDLVSKTLGLPIDIRREAHSAGDVKRTGGSADLAAAVIGWTPKISIEAGVAEQIEWHKSVGHLLAGAQLERQ